MKIISVLIGGIAIVLGTGVSRDSFDVASLCAKRDGHNMNDGILEYPWHPIFISELAVLSRNGFHDNELVEMCLWIDDLLDASKNRNYGKSARAYQYIDLAAKGIELMTATAPCLRGICSPISVSRADRSHEGLLTRTGRLCLTHPDDHDFHRRVCEEISRIANSL